MLKKGQSRGAPSGGFFGLLSAPKEDAAGQASTEEFVGKFKGLITVTHKDTEDDKKYEINSRLGRIRELLGDIYAKKYNGKQCPI